jgi:hypothetical protein
MSTDLGVARNVPIRDVMYEIKEDLGIEASSEYDTLIFRHIYTGALSLDTRDTYIKKWEDIDVVDFRIKLPAGMQRPLSIELPIAETNSTRQPNWVYFFETDSAPRKGMEGPGGINRYRTTRELGQIVGEYFVFNTEFVGEKVTLTYEGFNLDESCMLKLYRIQIRAISAYVKFQMSVSPKCKLLFRGIDTSLYYREWAAQKSYLQGEAFEREAESCKSQLKDLWVAMYVDENYHR